jgi:hypothetical protein
VAKNNNRNRGGNRKNYNNKSQEYQRFASTSATVSGTNTGGSRGINEARLKTMLQDPAKNAVQVAGLSKSMKQINGMYKRIIKYLSSLLTFDHTIYPVIENPIEFAEDPQQMQISFAQNAVFIDRLNVKFYLPMFAEKVFTNGVVYLYKLEDSKGVAYMEFPLNNCRIGYIEDGVYRFQFDVSKLSDATIELYPKEIQNAYTGYKNGNTEKLIEGKWYQVSDKGVAFSLDTDVLTQGGVSLPPLANALVDAIKIENAKDSMESTAKLDNTKIVHSKIETDDKGRPLMELPVVMEYHNALKRNLPEGSVAITNPFDTKGITLNGTGKDGKFALLEKAVENLYDGAGVSKLLFAGDGASSQALERSIQVDCQWLYSYLLPMFTNYYNYELKRAGKKGAIWKIKFLQISHFDREEAIKTAKDQLSYGGSRLEYLAYTGMTPLEVANVLVFEQRVLNIDELMVAKQTSHTMSGDDGGSEAGRPQSDDPTDTTIRIKDSE